MIRPAIPNGMLQKKTRGSWSAKNITASNIIIIPATNSCDLTAWLDFVIALYFNDASPRALTTEYEKLLQSMIEERKAKMIAVEGKDRKKAETLRKEISFLEMELSRYKQALSLFRTKGVPKVGRWGRPEVEGEEEKK